LAINKGQLKFVESPQMKLDKGSFPVNMNIIEVDGKKVLVRPSQAKSNKAKRVIIGEERPSRMTKPKILKAGQWPKNEKSKPLQRPKDTFNILVSKYKEGRANIRGHENRTI
jgi:hypothetical protein